MTNFKHLKKISAVNSANGINLLTPAVHRGNHCPMRIASVISENVKGLSTLLVGMQECTTHSRLFSPSPNGKNGEFHWLYVLDSNEVVFGCREGIINAIKKMDAKGAKSILLIVTCIPELIGEDIEGIVHEVQSSIEAKVTYVMLGQFKNVSYPPGYRKTMESLSVFMEARQTDRKRANVMGRAPDEEHIPMPMFLKELEGQGVKLRYIAPKASIDDFKESTDASINIVVTPFMQPLAEKMEIEFGIPYVELHNLYDIDEIHHGYKKIGEVLQIVLGDNFEDMRLDVLEVQRDMKEKLKNIKYISLPRVDMTIPLAYYFAKLGMEPLVLHLEEYYPEDKTRMKEIVKRGYNPHVCRMVNPESDKKILESLDADLYFGFMPNMIENISCMPDMLDYYGFIGYERTMTILKDIQKTLDRKRKFLEGRN